MNLTLIKRDKIETESDKPGISGLYYYLNPVIMTVLMVIIQIPYISIDWSQIFNAFIKLIITYGIISASQFFLTSVFSKRIIGVGVTNVLYLTLYISSYIKMFMTSTPILPINLAMLGEMNRISEFLMFPFKFWFMLGIALAAANLIIYIRIVVKEKAYEKFSLKRYIISFAVSMTVLSAVVYLVGFDGPVKNKFLNYFDCTVTGFDAENDYKKNGSVLTFFTYLDDVFIKQPEEYTEKNISDLQKEYENSNLLISKKPDKPINVIAIQAESWWDPMRLPNIEISSDPLSPIRELEGYSYEGKMITPAYGCNTCIPEFEFLTGSSTRLLPDGGYPYEQFVNTPIETLAQTYKSNNYNTIALHTYDKHFYNRSKAYPLMGFDLLKGDEDMENPVIKGMYISDDYMADQIIGSYEENLSTGKPIFIYSITMQNHGDFLEQRYTEYDFTVESEFLTEEELISVRDSVQGVYDNALMFVKLTEYFEKKDEPFLIVMYGDHLPFLGENSSAYINLGFSNDEGLAHNPQLFETPYIFWANFDISGYDFAPVAGPQYLGISTLKLSEIQKVHWTYNFLYDFYKKYPVYHYLKIINDKGETVKNVDKTMLSDYELIQYEILFGQQKDRLTP